MQGIHGHLEREQFTATRTNHATPRRAGIPRRITPTEGERQTLQFVARFDAKIAQLRTRPPMPSRQTKSTAAATGLLKESPSI